MTLYCYKVILILPPHFVSLVVQLEAAAMVASVTWVLKKTGACRCADVVCWLYWDLLEISAQFFSLNQSFRTPFRKLEYLVCVFSRALVHMGGSGVASQFRRTLLQSNFLLVCFGRSLQGSWLEAKLLGRGSRQAVRWAMRRHESRCHEPEKVPSGFIWSPRLPSVLLRREFTVPS